MHLKTKTSMVLSRPGKANEFPRVQLEADILFNDVRAYLEGTEVHLQSHEVRVARMLLLEELQRALGVEPGDEYERKVGL